MEHEFSKERERLITDMILYSVYSEHLEKFTFTEIQERLGFFFDKKEIEIVISRLKESI